MPPCGVALGFGLVEGFSKDGVLIGFGVEVGTGVERSVETGDGEENCVSKKCSMKHEMNE